MGRADYLALGDWNVKCFECGRTRKASTLKKNWKGYYVCPEHWEPRHPQDFVRGTTDKTNPPWVQPDLPPEYVPMCTPNDQSAVSGFAVAGCVTTGFISGAFDPTVVEM